MKKNSLFKIVFVFLIICLTASVFAFSLSACDITDDDAGFQHVLNLPILSFFGTISSILLLASNQIALDLQWLHPSSAILYLELHETSPPDIF